ncbi:MAG TPA: bifunctional diaminohydroxyphosphoribosylaminopyrimidine deaminase/5-amino-6-(5-phosphoribosylamino)uracil reductase RibD [Nitrospiraceae bacterium]|nr:bifunctional diaminohydroxyphosphoribosylaminopyrimidine deaminase/5-amino-6-(5-phosphoribosylamino)uracil reductase RibD [Nitrospiraceae bacterium]
MNKDIFMKRALALAARAKGRTSPNPLVGAVIVKGNKIIAQGYHRKAGTPHAEVIALKKAGTECKGATLYVNLEPCCHTEKKTPPCTRLIIESGVKKVVVAMIDPNPKVSGRGIKELKDAGLAVEVGVMEPEARELNEAFIKFITKKEPFVILKVAQSLDGKIATPAGESRWITGEKAQNYVHKLRSSVDAVLVGIGTVLKDNPSLTSRIPGGRDPYRIIIDSFLRIPLDAKVLIHNSDAKTIIATTRDAEKEKINSLKAQRVNILVIKDINGKVDLKALMKELGKLDITSVMIEGGSSINASAFQSGIVDKVMFFTAPKIIGGRDAISSIGGEFTGTLKNSIKMHNLKVKKIGEDILLEGYIPTVIPRLDRGIQSFQEVLDCPVNSPVKPEKDNDNILSF